MRLLISSWMHRLAKILDAHTNILNFNVVHECIEA